MIRLTKQKLSDRLAGLDATLMYAAACGDDRTVIASVEDGANVNCLDSDGNTPAHEAAGIGRINHANAGYERSGHISIIE